MAKSKKGIMSLLPVIAAGLGLIALITIFMPAIAMKEAVRGAEPINGLKAAFGYSEKFGNASVKVLNFSFMNTLAYLLVLVGAGLSALTYFKGENKLFTLIAAGCFVVATILFFCFVPFAGWLEETKDLWQAMKKSPADFYKLEIGPILGAICSLLAAGASAVSIVKK